MVTLKKGDRFRVVAKTDFGFIGECEHADGSVTRFSAGPSQEGKALPPAAKQVIWTQKRDGGEHEITDTFEPMTSSVSAAHDGPARVTSDAYRDGYDRVFGRKKQTAAELN